MPRRSMTQAGPRNNRFSQFSLSSAPSSRRDYSSNYVSERHLDDDADESPGISVTIRPPRERKAMSQMDRRRIFYAKPVHNRKEESEDERPQYTVQSRPRETETRSLLSGESFWACPNMTSTADYRYYRHKKRFWLDVNNIIHQYLSWSFRTSYIMLYTSFTLLYFITVLIFAAVYYWTSLAYPECITSNSNPIGHNETRMFGDSFQLSWTTFSSVGYGLIYPATGSDHPSVPSGCVGLSILCSFEAFLGLIFADACACVLFGKVLRSQNNAQVTFSDPIVIRYGQKELSESDEFKSQRLTRGSRGSILGDMAKQGRDEGVGGRSRMSIKKDQIPCPSLEFRLINSLHSKPSGEIVEAKLECVAILDSKHPKRNEAQQIRDDYAVPEVNEHTTIKELAAVLSDVDTRKSARSLDFHEADSKQPHMFTNVALDADEHPYFRRVWFGRHRLDEDSPLLTPEARNRVKSAGGYWPADMNNYWSIKSSLNFHQLLVCISGTSNASAAPVYAQRVYHLIDVHVGHRFVPMNYHTDTGMLKTDPFLLNAVYPQRGGGAEPLDCEQDQRDGLGKKFRSLLNLDEEG